MLVFPQKHRPTALSNQGCGAILLWEEGNVYKNVILKISFIEMFENTIHLFIILANLLIYR